MEGSTSVECEADIERRRQGSRASASSIWTENGNTVLRRTGRQRPMEATLSTDRDAYIDRGRQHVWPTGSSTQAGVGHPLARTLGRR
jgi:hypothetical protein